MNIWLKILRVVNAADPFWTSGLRHTSGLGTLGPFCNDVQEFTDFGKLWGYSVQGFRWSGAEGLRGYGIGFKGSGVLGLGSRDLVVSKTGHIKFQNKPKRIKMSILDNVKMTPPKRTEKTNALCKFRGMFGGAVVHWVASFRRSFWHHFWVSSSIPNKYGK